MKKILIVFLFSIVLTTGLFAERVIKVADGDTVTVLNDKQEQIRIRLWGIDAPEKKQAFGEASRKFLANKIAGKDVRVETKGKDQYGRTIAVLWLGDEDVNLRQVQCGYAWHYVQYAKKATSYAAAERKAREKKLGLWQEGKPIPPWDYRRSQRRR